MIERHRRPKTTFQLSGLRAAESVFFDQKSLQMVRFPIGFHKDGILFLHTDFKLFETDAVKVILYLDMLFVLFASYCRFSLETAAKLLLF